MQRIEFAFTTNPEYMIDACRSPVGLPPGKGYYNAQGFGRSNPRFGNQLHLGEDWNGTGGGNSDLGDPVYSACNGFVYFTGDAGPGWGNVIRMVHREQGGKYYESVYAHLDTIDTRAEMMILAGERIGTIGDADGAYPAHLHFEFREKVLMELGGGYDFETEGWISPSDFIREHGPRPGQ